MTELEAVFARHSRRAYIGPPNRAQIDEFHDIIEDIESVSGLTIRLFENSGDLFGGFTKHYGMFSGVSSFFLLAGQSSDVDLKEKCGYYGQKIVLKATEMGLGTCWVGGTFNRETLKRTLHEDQQLVALITVGKTENKPSFKERLIYTLAKHRNKPLDEMYSSDSTPPSWFMEGVRSAALAPSALNRKPAKFVWKDKTASAFVPDVSGYQGIDLGIAKLHFEVAAKGSFALGNNAEFTKA